MEIETSARFIRRLLLGYGGTITDEWRNDHALAFDVQAYGKRLWVNFSRRELLMNDNHEKLALLTMARLKNAMNTSIEMGAV